jgi:hypothetical protein
MATNDRDNPSLGASRDAFCDEQVPRRRFQKGATALVGVLLATALVLPGCAQRTEPAQPSRPVGRAPVASVIPPPARLRSGPVVPWRPAPPSKQHPTPAAPGCRAATVRTGLTWQGLHQEAVTGTVQLANGGADDCSLPLSPYPRYELLDEHGTRLPVSPLVSQPAPPPHPSQVVLRPGGAITAQVYWFNWCRPTPKAVAVRLPISAGGPPQTSTSAPVAVTPPPCLHGEQPSIGDGQAFTLAAPAAGTLYGAVTSLGMRLQVQRSAAAGAALPYRVTLANRGNWIVPLRPCPNYAVTLNLRGPDGRWTVQHQRRYGLACEALGGALRPGEQATFELVATVPAGARPGHSLLSWTVEGQDGSGGAEAEFWVTKHA